jgi:hypothetical protein
MAILSNGSARHKRFGGLETFSQRNPSHEFFQEIFDRPASP